MPSIMMRFVVKRLMEGIKPLTLLKMFRGSMDKLQRDKFEPALLKAGDDVANQRALDTVRLARCTYMRRSQAKRQ